ncbi:hypothetical protein SAMN02910429_00978 [Lachnobacterium bovis]|uniref:Uncharacterized protein n=1 Tax=Lachnobacterium bovis TaxID=140626 RepID=A0A1H9RSI3_9FIRM|nr:hypothetical protein SAMN02910429_00978 [Lachnobacterium bovis]
MESGDNGGSRSGYSSGKETEGPGIKYINKFYICLTLLKNI